MLYIVCGVLAIALLWFAIKWFNEHCDEKFGHEFFTMPMLVVLGIAGGLCLFGSSWYSSALEENNVGRTLFTIVLNGDTLNGLILMTLGILIYLVVAICNFRETNWIYGIIGTILQFGMLSIFAYIGFILLAIWFIAIFLFFYYSDD
ncbi:hypothetical protein [Ignatzschineria sp. LJL83]